MSKHVLLNNVDHRDVTVDNSYSAEYGDNVPAVLTFPTEFADVQREYPILFHKDPVSGEFRFVAILGFEQGENLYLTESGWDADYVPAIQARGPFLIGFQEHVNDGELTREPVIHIDLDNPRVNASKGESPFLAHGGNSPYLENIASVLKCIHEGLEASKHMFRAFEALDLIEPVTIEVTLPNETVFKMGDYYTINQDRLANLTGEQLEALNHAGLLRGAFLVISSLSNIRHLIEKKNKRMAAFL